MAVPGSTQLLRHDHPGQVLDVHLVHDPGTRRDHLELTQRVLAPAQEREPLVVAAELQVHVALERVRPAEHVSDHRMVDHQLGGNQRIDLARIAAEFGHRLAHDGQVHHRRHAGQVLHDHPCRAELDFGGRLGRRIPARESGDVRLR